MANSNRTKGQNYERRLVHIFKSFGFLFAKTSRLASRLLDNCKVDLVGVPFIIQAKAGYPKKRPKFDVISRQIKEELNKHFPKEHVIHDFPIVLCHKLNGYKKENTFWTFAEEDIVNILQDYFRLLKEKEEWPPIIT
jgi:hypothetical protein